MLKTSQANHIAKLASRGSGTNLSPKAFYKTRSNDSHWAIGFDRFWLLKRKTFESWPHIWQACAYPHFNNFCNYGFVGCHKKDFYFINAWEIFYEVATN
jgi:hypothetical protein